MKLVARLNEYSLTENELTELMSYLEKRDFKARDNFPNIFLNAKGIFDRTEDVEHPIDSGAIIYHPWGGSENKGLIVYRDTRLDRVVRNYISKIKKISRVKGK